MNHMKATRYLILALIFLLLGTAVSCATTDETEEPTTEASSEVDVPDEVMLVRNAALEHLRTIAQIMVPPESTPWNTTTTDDFAETGTGVYLFSAEEDKLSISYPTPVSEETLFYVALRNASLDFCWQGLINSEGEIQSTGYDEVEPGLANPSALYCEEQGFTFEIRTREDGKQCGACVFAEDDVCNAWDYFYGTCAPSE